MLNNSCSTADAHSSTRRVSGVNCSKPTASFRFVGVDKYSRRDAATDVLTVVSRLYNRLCCRKVLGHDLLAAACHGTASTKQQLMRFASVLQVNVDDGEWLPWSNSVPKTQLEPHRIVDSDVVITTTDTVRYTATECHPDDSTLHHLYLQTCQCVVYLSSQGTGVSRSLAVKHILPLGSQQPKRVTKDVFALQSSHVFRQSTAVTDTPISSRSHRLACACVLGCCTAGTWRS